MVFVFLVGIRLQNLVQKDSNNTILVDYSKDVTVSSMNFGSLVQVCKLYSLLWSLMTIYDYQSIKLSFFLEYSTNNIPIIVLLEVSVCGIDTNKNIVRELFFFIN